MKKLVSLMLALAMILSVCPTALALDHVALEAKILPSTHIVNVVGQYVDNNSEPIQLLLVDDNKNIKYIAETELEDNKYRVKFKYTGEDFASLKLRVKQGQQDITNTVISALAEAEPISYQVNILKVNGKTLLDTKIENYYNVPGKTYTVMLAYYGENNNLLNIHMQETKEIGFDTTTTPEAEYDIPEDAKIVKVFMWDKTTSLVPLTNEIEAKTKDIRVLLIGHSFVDDSRAYLTDIAKADGVDLTVDWVTYGGGSFTHHWGVWSAPFETQEEAEAYDKANGLKVGTTSFRRRYHGQVKTDLSGNVLTDEFGENMTEFTKSIDDFLDNYEYDYIAMTTLYGALPFDAIPSIGYNGYPGSADDIAGQNMVKYLREKQPTAEIALINTWAYEKESTGHIGQGKHIFGYGTTFDQDKMWEQIRKTVVHQTETYAKLVTDSGLPVSLDGKPLRYVPSGQAINNARQSAIFDTKYYHGYTNQASSNFKFVDDEHPEYITLHRDSYHMSKPYGRYLAGLVMYGVFTGNSVIGNKYVNPTAKWRIGDREKLIIQEAVQKAINDCGRWN